MNNLYYKIAVASVCTALSFALGANKEAYSATFNLKSINYITLLDLNLDGLSDMGFHLPKAEVGIRGSEEGRAFYLFNIPNLFPTSNTYIDQAIFQARVNTISGNDFSFQVDLFGFTANRHHVSDVEFDAGVYLDSDKPRQVGQILSFDVTPLINQNIRDTNAFAWFGLHGNGRGNITIEGDTSLTITTVDVAEPVPEPITIFGSALALSLGGWLKRKTLSQQNKTMP